VIICDTGPLVAAALSNDADHLTCVRVVAVDLTEEYCDTARWLNQLAGLDGRICVRQADVTDLPFEDAAFTQVFSQHGQMNVADKALLYAQARRVLAAGAGWRCGTSPPARTANPTFRCPGPTGPDTAT